MLVTQEQKNQIAQDFIDIFQARYGEGWRSKLSMPLKPSPIHQIAEQRGVTVSEVKKIRRQFIAVGHLLEFMELLTSPSETPIQESLIL